MIRVKHLIDDIMRAVISIKPGNFEDEENELGGNDESEKLKRRDLQEKSSWGFMRSNSIQASTVQLGSADPVPRNIPTRVKGKKEETTS